MTYTMDVETHAEGVKQHPFHLGTDREVAIGFVNEALKREGVISVALRKDGKIDRIFDSRD